jgi:hypothetical protein
MQHVFDEERRSVPLFKAIFPRLQLIVGTVLGLKRTSNMIRDIFWTPFDNRFSRLLGRIRDHQELFDREMTLDNQKAVERKLDRTLNGMLKMEQHVASKQPEKETNLEEAVKNQKKENERLESVIKRYFYKLEEEIRSVKEQQRSESDHIAAEEMKALSKYYASGWTGSSQH